MARVDWSEEETFDAGVYRVTVLSAQEKTARSGAPMLSIRLGATDFEDEHIAYDNIMLGGKGRGMGHQKLKAFGIPSGQTEVGPMDLEGKQVIAVIVQGEYQGKPKLEVATDKGYCGYFPLEEEGKAGTIKVPNVPNAGEENPFLQDDGSTPF